MKRWNGTTRVAACVVAALIVVGAAACGSDDKASTSTGGTGTTTAGASGSDDFTLDEPAKLAALVEVGGESPQATDDAYNAYSMAIEDINASGGIGGHPVETERFPAGLSPEGFTSAVQKAEEADASVAVGLLATSYLRAALPTIAELEMPVLSMAPGSLTADEVTQSDGWLFQPNVSDASGPMPDAAAQYAVEGLKAKKVGIMYVDLAFGKTGAAAVKAQVEKLGGEVVAERSYAFDATDLTEQVLAMKGADVIVNWAYPGPLAIQLNTAAQNGIDVPTISAVSASLVVSNELAPANVTKQLYGSTYCNPLRDAEWAARYEAKFGTVPADSAAAIYDDTMIAAEAIRIAQSTDAAKIKDALASMTYTEGVCAQRYHVLDGSNTMAHSATVNAWGTGRPVAVLELDEG